MNRLLPAIIFVPGIRAKPPVEEQAAALRRCLHAAVRRSGGSDAEATDLAACFEVIGWSHGFYQQHADISVDQPGIERLVAGSGDVAEDIEEATGASRRVNAVLYAIADYFPILSRLFASTRMETRMQEINRYMDDEQGAGTAIRSMLVESLQAAWANKQRVMLIGHSFGSVIAYDTLWELSQYGAESGDVDQFITAGSPLTMRYIRRRLKGTNLKGAARYPHNIRRWLNLAAIGEATALDRKLADCFAPMQKLGLVEQIDDNLQLVNQFRGPDGLNVHKCYGYFASDAMGQAILKWYRSV